MPIIISPRADYRDSEVSISGDIVTVDGVPFDLSQVPEGGTATPSDDRVFSGAITRKNGELFVRLRLSYNQRTAVADLPSDLPTLPWVNGPIPDPIPRKEVSA